MAMISRQFWRSTGGRLAFSSSSNTCRILVSTIVERLPVIIPDPEPWEAEFEDMQASLNQRFTKPIPTFLKKRLDDRMAEPDMVKLKKTFTPAPRITEDDVNDVRTSVNRKLDRSLLLIIKNINGKWDLPQSMWTDESETIRQTAERALSECVTDVEASFTGQAPLAHLEIEAKSDLSPSKVFFLRSLYVGGTVSGCDYLWVTKEEASDYVEPKVANIIQQLIAM